MSARSFIARRLLAACSPAGKRARLSILIFHRVTAARDPLFPGEVDAARFDEIVGWLAEWLTVLPLHEAAARLGDGTLPAGAACITFDDGYADNYTQALPILARHGVHATFFIATGFLDGGRMWNDTIIESVRRTPHAAVDLAALGLGVVPTRSHEDKRATLRKIIVALKHRAADARDAGVRAVAAACAAALPGDLMLTSDQLRRLHSAGMGIGAHTVTHPILARCDDATARREIVESRERLETLLGERIGLFAYPNGKLGDDYMPAHATLAAELGFDAAVTTNAGASRHGDDRFQLRRFTPWDRDPLRFGVRLARNVLRGSAA